MRIMFTMNASNSMPPALCPLPYLSFSLYRILLTLPHFHANLSSISKKKPQLCLSNNHLPITAIFLHQRKKEASFPEWLVLSVSTSLHWHLWIKTIPCALLCLPRCVRSVTRNKHKIHTVSHTTAWKHGDQQHLRNDHFEKKSSLSKVGSCQY